MCIKKRSISSNEAFYVQTQPSLWLSNVKGLHIHSNWQDIQRGDIETNLSVEEDIRSVGIFLEFLSIDIHADGISFTGHAVFINCQSLF